MEWTGTYQEYMSSTLTRTPPSLGSHCWESSLEESLLILGQFEEAHDELWAWLVDSLQQLMEPISGDPDAVKAQLSNPMVKIVEMFLRTIIKIFVATYSLNPFLLPMLNDSDHDIDATNNLELPCLKTEEENDFGNLVTFAIQLCATRSLVGHETTQR